MSLHLSHRGLLLTGLAALFLVGQLGAQGLNPKVAEAEKKRIAAINKVKPSVVAVMARDLRGNLTGNGSGVLIDDEGYALTNWHVTSAARSPLLKCGLPTASSTTPSSSASTASATSP